jgi:hypothetical protein
MTTATDAANTLSVPGFTLHVILEAARTTSGGQFGALLERAGLSRFISRSPPPNNQLVATPLEMKRLFTQFYEVLGEPLTRLAFRTWGREIANYVMAPQPWGDQLRADVLSLPPDRQLGALVYAVGALGNAYWSPTEMSEDETAWYMTLTPCMICLGICELAATLPPAQRPTTALCTNLEGAIPAIVYQVLKRRIIVTEIACAATGAPHCKYAIYKPARKAC